MEKATDGMKTSTPGSFHRKRSIYTCLRRIYKVTMIISAILLVLIYSQCGKSFHEKQVTQAAELPQRFFPSRSSVLDYPYGNLQPVIKLLHDEELIFVMYYAPWCAESAHIRHEFIKAAQVLSDTIKFVGVNCWYAEGECRQRMKFLSYPELFVYHTGVQEGYRFYGIKEAEYFVKFAESFIYPLKPLHSVQELQAFYAQQENTVVGYFDFNASPQPPGSKFHQFYLAALRLLTYEFYQPIKFGVVRSRQLAKFLDLKAGDRFVMFRMGTLTLKYPLLLNMTCKNITTWVLRNRIKSYAPWLVPPGVKSLTLSLPLQAGPSVLVFAPINPLQDFNPYMNMLRTASYAYRSCGNQTDLHADFIKTMVLNSFNTLHKGRQLMNSSIGGRQSVNLKIEELSSLHCCMSLPYGCCVENHNCVCEYCVHHKNNHKKYGCHLDLRQKVSQDSNIMQMNTCSDFYQSYNVNEHHSLCCRQKNVDFQTTLFPYDSAKRTRKVTDPYIATGRANFLKRHMRKMSLQKLKQHPSLEHLSRHVTKMSDIKSVNLTGLFCRTNKTVSFYLLDKTYHSVFLEHFGFAGDVDLHKQSSVILIDLKQESQYILRQELTYRNLAQFVFNFTSGLLDPYHKSEEGQSSSHCDDTNTACLTQVTSETFHSIVMDNDKDVLLLYYTPWCGFCAQFAQVYLTVAQYFSDMKNITFARINAEANDLPWQYTVDSYPTLLFFPASRKSDSITFPQSVQRTVPNLIKFISYYANQSVQINTAISMCTKDCIAKNTKRVIAKIAELETIVSQLERWEITIWSQAPSNEEQRKFMRKEVIEIRKTQEEYRKKLYKAKTLNHFLQKNNWKTLDRKTFVQFLRTSMEL